MKIVVVIATISYVISLMLFLHSPDISAFTQASYYYFFSLVFSYGIYRMKSLIAASYIPLPFDEKEEIVPVVIRHVYEQNRSGYVYLLKEVNGTNYKIGRTYDPKDRLRVFSVKLPFAVEFTCVIETSNMFELESALHDRYRAKRINGEWFALTDEDIEYIKRLQA